MDYQVLVLAPNDSKLYSWWQGPGTIIQVKSPYSFIVEVDGKKMHVHANKIKKFHDRVKAVMVNNCAVIYERDEEFGSVETVEALQQVPVDLPSSKIDRKKLAHLSDEQREQLLSVLDQFSEVFSEKPGLISVVEYEIKINAYFQPRRLRQYRVPEALKEEVARQIHEMLELGIIRLPQSEMASPLVCVLKGPDCSGGVRLAVDFRYVNRFSAGEATSLPDLTDAIERVSRANYISVYDAKSGCWQVPLAELFQWLSTFICEGKLYEFTRMTFGLRAAGWLLLIRRT